MSTLADANEALQCAREALEVAVVAANAAADDAHYHAAQDADYFAPAAYYRAAQDADDANEALQCYREALEVADAHFHAAVVAANAAANSKPKD